MNWFLIYWIMCASLMLISLVATSISSGGFYNYLEDKLSKDNIGKDINKEVEEDIEFTIKYYNFIKGGIGLLLLMMLFVIISPIVVPYFILTYNKRKV